MSCFAVHLKLYLPLVSNIQRTWYFLLCPDMYTTLKPLQSGLSYLSLYLMHFDVMASNDAVDTVIT